MKLKSMLALGVLVVTGSIASAADTTTIFTITGATAFRAAANTAIINLLGGPANCEYAFDQDGQSLSINGTNRAIFRRIVVTNTPNPGDTATTIVRVSWSGSTGGILALADQAAVQCLKTTVTMAVGGSPIVDAAASDFELVTPRFSFSDVDKALSQRPTSAIQEEVNGVGVVPFMFVAGESAPAAITNMTDQIHNTLWAVGEMPASMMTGNPADAGFTLLATGRSDSSGTRAGILSETQYGSFNTVVQFNQTTTGDRLTGSLTGSPFLFGSGGNGGHSSNSFVRDLVTRTSSPTFAGGQYAFVSYLTISDAISATGYNQLTGAVSGGEGAKPLTYNGVRYSEQNVYNGQYTLWTTQQLYRAADATAGETQFSADLKASIDTILTPSIGLRTSLMQVERSGGDGGPINPL
jgi:hypothetical protein